MISTVTNLVTIAAMNFSAPTVTIQCEASQIGFQWSKSVSLQSDVQLKVEDQIQFEVAYRHTPGVEMDSILLIQYNLTNGDRKHAWRFDSPTGELSEVEFLTDYKGAYMPCRLIKSGR